MVIFHYTVKIVMGNLFIITGLMIIKIDYQVEKIYRKYCFATMLKILHLIQGI